MAPYRQVWFIALVDKHVVVHVKLWDVLKMRTISEQFCSDVQNFNIDVYFQHSNFHHFMYGNPIQCILMGTGSPQRTTVLISPILVCDLDLLLTYLKKLIWFTLFCNVTLFFLFLWDELVCELQWVPFYALCETGNFELQY